MQMLLSTIFVGGTIVLVTLFRKGKLNRVVYMFKFSVYVLLFSILALISIPVNIIRGGRKEDGSNVIPFVPFIRMISTIIGVEWEVHGKERLALEGAAIVVANHQTVLDALCLAHLWPTMSKCSVIVKRSLLWVFPFGIGIWLAGFIFIDRKSSLSCKEGMTHAGEVMTKTGTKIWIFPEGTRSKRSELQPFKKGAFQLALENKVPIIPVVYGPYTFIRDEEMWFGRGKVQISVLPRIETDNKNMSREAVDKLAEDVRHKMNIEFDRLCKQEPVVVEDNNNK